VDLAAVNDQSGRFEGTDWLESKINAKQSIGFHLIWTLDRSQGENHPVAMVCFADNNTVLLLRTHRTENWLPPIVIRVLQTQSCTKVTIDWEKHSKGKMDNTFHWQPLGMEDLADVSRKKGVNGIGLKQLARALEVNIKKDASVERSDWTVDNITEDQLEYAAEEVYFTYVLHDRLLAMVDIELENPHMEDGLLAMAPGWEDQGIRRRHDGLHCDVCCVGPMSDPKNVPEHLKAKKHIRNIKVLLGITGGEDDNTPLEIADDWVMNGIEVPEKNNHKYEFICKHCDTLLQMGNVKAHIASKRHKRLVDGLIDDPSQEHNPLSRFKEQLLVRIWNLPDYVKVLEPSSLICEICPVTADSVQQMLNHLAGNNHRKKCFAHKPTPQPELIFVKERDRLEDLLSGAPIIRTGHQAPKKKREPALSTAAKTATTAATTATTAATTAATAAAKAPMTSAPTRPVPVAATPTAGDSAQTAPALATVLEGGQSPSGKINATATTAAAATATTTCQRLGEEDEEEQAGAHLLLLRACSSSSCSFSAFSAAPAASARCSPASGPGLPF